MVMDMNLAKGVQYSTVYVYSSIDFRILSNKVTPSLRSFIVIVNRSSSSTEQ
jgi:hypothetical protein